MTTAISNSAPDHTATTNPLAQLRAARRKPIAAIIGATAGLVPVGVYEVGHHELTSWSPIECPKAMIVYAGLLFSALTVLGWSTNMFGARAKALGFTLLLEGIMMTSSAGWLTAIALTYLVLINAVGERLSARAARCRASRDRLVVEPGAEHRRCGGRCRGAVQERPTRAPHATRRIPQDAASACGGRAGVLVLSRGAGWARDLRRVQRSALRRP